MKFTVAILCLVAFFVTAEAFSDNFRQFMMFNTLARRGFGISNLLDGGRRSPYATNNASPFGNLGMWMLMGDNGMFGM